MLALACSVPGLIAMPRELAKGNRLILLVLVLPLVGLWILALAGHRAWRRRKYGTARFVGASLPIPFGRELAGMIVVDRPVIPTAAGRVTLDCWRSPSPRSGKSDDGEDVASHTEREIAKTEWTTEAHESRLFVQLPVRGGAPTSATRGAGGDYDYEWRLIVRTPTAGADFVAEFVLPVFEIADG